MFIKVFAEGEGSRASRIDRAMRNSGNRTALRAYNEAIRRLREGRVAYQPPGRPRG
ncbi:MAG: hypothetical protein H0Z24_05630 [Thermosipho sp. (in: Bacteria)]|nr:hypothetical protein [Thermosipho sp. (in: thermotogales)]